MGGLTPPILVGFSFKRPPKKMLTKKKKGQKGQSEVQNSSADKKNKKVNKL
jgi:hypothetical protein